MSTIFALAGLNTDDYRYAQSADRQLIYDAVNTYVQTRNAATRAASAFLVEGDTTNGRMKYQLPMTGRDERVRADATGPTLKRYGGWEVGFPLYTYNPRVTLTNVAMAQLTPAEFQAHIDGVANRYDETMRFEMLYALFNNTQRTFTDPEGTLTSETIEPLANGDAVVYPPVLGAASEATENHYLESGYATAAISDTNNPIKTIADDLIQHFGRMTGGSDVVVLINPAEQAKIEALSGFVEVRDSRVQLNDTAAELSNIPLIPGEVIGRVSGATVSVWDWIPSGYLLGRYMGAPAPLMRRVDGAPTLGAGNVINLEKLSTGNMEYNSWQYRFGFGVGNRLNAVVMELGTGGSYSIPSDYA